MKTYIYTVRPYSAARDYNMTVVVHRIKHNVPEFVGMNEEINTAAYKGAYAVACQILADREHYKLADNGYKLASKNIQLLEI